MAQLYFNPPMDLVAGDVGTVLGALLTESCILPGGPEDGRYRLEAKNSQALANSRSCMYPVPKRRFQHSFWLSGTSCWLHVL